MSEPNKTDEKKTDRVHVDVIKGKHFPRYWPFVRGIHRWPVNSPHKGPVTRSFDVFFDMWLNKHLSKQSWGWWFETLSRPLWRHSNVLVVWNAMTLMWRYCNEYYPPRQWLQKCLSPVYLVLNISFDGPILPVSVIYIHIRIIILIALIVRAFLCFDVVGYRSIRHIRFQAPSASLWQSCDPAISPVSMNHESVTDWQYNYKATKRCVYCMGYISFC